MLSSTVIRTYVLFWYKFRENWLKKKEYRKFCHEFEFLQFILTNGEISRRIKRLLVRFNSSIFLILSKLQLQDQLKNIYRYIR